MSIKEAILQLKDLGLILYILDDGWKHRHSKNNDTYNINLAVHGLSEEEKILLLKQFDIILGIKGKIICSDKNTIKLKKNDNIKFIEILKKYKLLGLDVTNKKF